MTGNEGTPLVRSTSKTASNYNGQLANDCNFVAMQQIEFETPEYLTKAVILAMTTDCWCVTRPDWKVNPSSTTVEKSLGWVTLVHFGG